MAENDRQSPEEIIEDLRARLEEVCQSEQKYRSLFENAVEGIFRSTPGGAFLNVNPSMAAILGYDSPEDLLENVDDIPHQLYKESLVRQQLLDAVARDGKVSGFEAQVYKKDMQLAWISISARPVLDANGKLLFYEGFILDITRKKEMDRELDRHRNKLEGLVAERTAELSRTNEALTQSIHDLKIAQHKLIASEKMAALGSLVAGVAHEVSTPVGIAVTAVSFLDEKTREVKKLLDQGKLGKSALQDYLKISEDSTSTVNANLERAKNFINSFKMVAVDQSHLEKRRFKLFQYIEDIILSLRPRLKKTSHKIKVDCPVELVLETEPGAISQILTNMIINTLIHGFDKKENGLMRIRARAQGADLSLTFSDNGRGMDNREADRVFDPFFTTLSGQGGSGLGMHIVYELITQTLGGTIRCETSPGTGAAFYMVIPNIVVGREEQTAGDAHEA